MRIMLRFRVIINNSFGEGLTYVVLTHKGASTQHFEWNETLFGSRVKALQCLLKRCCLSLMEVTCDLCFFTNL